MCCSRRLDVQPSMFFFFTATATTEIYTLSLHDALPIWMELLAAIAALESLTRPVAVRLHTDSVYVRSGITSWLRNWKRNGWLRSEEHTSELQSQSNLVCRLLLEKKKKKKKNEEIST